MAGIAAGEAERGGMSYQPYTTLLSMCSICKKRHCNLLTTLLKDNMRNRTRA